MEGWLYSYTTAYVCIVHLLYRNNEKYDYHLGKGNSCCFLRIDRNCFSIWEVSFLWGPVWRPQELLWYVVVQVDLVKGLVEDVYKQQLGLHRDTCDTRGHVDCLRYRSFQELRGRKVEELKAGKGPTRSKDATRGSWPFY